MSSNIKDESFRDSIATIGEDGKRTWIYPKKPHGKLYNKRTIVSIILLTLLFSGPFMKWNGHAMFLFNVIQRKFILFGIPFWPQDFFLFVLAMLTFFVFIILFIVVFGRVWCVIRAIGPVKFAFQTSTLAFSVTAATFNPLSFKN